MWYKRFGYQQNPFELDPFKTEYTVVNHNEIIDNVLYLVESGNIIVIEGGSGSGKTTFLRRIVDNFRGEGKVIYIDGNIIGKEPDIERILDRRGKRLLNIFDDKPKGLIILLDNVEALSKKNCEKIKYYFDQNHIKSVVFTTQNYQQLDISKSLKDRIVHNIISVPKLNKYEALRIIRERFSDHFFLSDEVIIRLFNQSKHNIKKTLQMCNDLCSFVVQEGRGEALPKYIPYIVKKRSYANSKMQVQT
ncbi:MAG: AAA family ATPase [Candidatus Woesearchaeota archaeon]